jgi:hypothetical protein
MIPDTIFSRQCYDALPLDGGSMLTRSSLEKIFRVYFDEIERCIDGKCYWAVLHVILVLPDVCGAMETDDGEATPQKYKNWCKRYLADKLINSDDWYRMRCIILHQGRTLDEKAQYSAFAFGQPSQTGSTVHRCVKFEPHGKVLQLDVGRMADEMRVAINKWFEAIENNEQPSFNTNVSKNAGQLVQSYDSSAVPIAIQISTTSSPRPRL